MFFCILYNRIKTATRVEPRSENDTSLAIEILQGIFSMCGLCVRYCDILLLWQELWLCAVCRSSVIQMGIIE